LIFATIAIGRVLPLGQDVVPENIEVVDAQIFVIFQLKPA